MFLFFGVLLVLFELIVCQTNDSIVFQELYKKFKTNSRSDSEVNVIQDLYEINEQIISFDYEFKNNGKEVNPKFIDKILTDFIQLNVEKILKVIDIRDIFSGGLPNSISCLACHSLINILFNTYIPVNIIGDVILGFCLTLQITDVPLKVCKGYVNIFKDHLDYVRRHTHLKRPEVCGILLGVHCYFTSGNCFNNPKPVSNNLCWKLDLSYDKQRDRIPQNETIYRILHLTDIHVDKEYVPYVPNCGQPYCCRSDLSKNTSSIQNPEVGYWGSYHCDPPIVLVENLFETIDWQSIDLVYWTGDVSPHDSWADTWNRTIGDSRFISDLLKKYSKSLVIGAIGNHLPIPVGTFSPPNIQNRLSSKLIYNELAEEWSQWLDTESLKTFLFGGYYSRRIRPGFRVIVVNTNYCARLNIWTYYQSIDPANQLKWLSNQLDLAEKSGDFVHIVGHIPTDNRECTQSWLYNYLAIIERYNDIIVGQFYGHSHYDEFRVLHSNNDCNQTIGSQILSPGLSPYYTEGRLNPAYREILINEYGEIQDLETFTFELSRVNEVTGAKPEWYREYSFKTDYSIGINSIELNEFYETLIRDNYYLQLFYSHYTRINAQQNDYCDIECKTKLSNDLKVCNPFDSTPNSITTIG